MHNYKKVYWSRHYKLQLIKIVILYTECLRNIKILAGDWVKTQYTCKLQQFNIYYIEQNKCGSRPYDEAQLIGLKEKYQVLIKQ